MADGGHFEGGVTPQQSNPADSSASNDSQTSIASLQSEMANQQESFDTAVPVLPGNTDTTSSPLELQLPNTAPKQQSFDELRKELVDAEDAKRAEDEKVSMALKNEGEPAAVLAKVGFVREKMKKALNKTDEEIDELLQSDAGKALASAFYEVIKNEKEQSQGSPLTPEQESIIRADAEKRAREFGEKTGAEIVGEMAGVIWDNIDGETFLMAIVGLDVGVGRYGQSSRDNQAEIKENPAEFILSALDKYPSFRRNILEAGAAACRDVELRKILASGSSEQINEHLHDLLENRAKCLKFVWGMSNILGNSQATARMDMGIAVHCLETIRDRIHGQASYLDSSQQHSYSGSKIKNDLGVSV